MRNPLMLQEPFARCFLLSIPSRQVPLTNHSESQQQIGWSLYSKFMQAHQITQKLGVDMVLGGHPLFAVRRAPLKAAVQL